MTANIYLDDDHDPGAFVEAKASVLRLLAFWLGDERYCVELVGLKEIAKIDNMTTVPDVPEYVKGVTDLHGEILTVCDIRQALDQKEAVRGAECLVMVADITGPNVGLLVDGIFGVLDVEARQLEPTLVTMSPAQAAFTKGVVKNQGELYTVLDLAKLLQFGKKE